MPTQTSERHPPSASTLPWEQTQAGKLLASTRFREAKRELLATIAEASRGVREVRPAGSPEIRAQYAQAISEFQRDRGRELYFPYLSSGLGSGPFIELVDGSVKFDLITGIGINFFGHSHPELIAEMIDGLGSDVMQGNLQPGYEAARALEAVLTRVGAGSRLTHGWLLCSGTMANEVALKIIRQKHAPATRILAFQDCFAGRSTAMQEITDNPGYRQGQPTYGEVSYLPFYDPARGLAESIALTLSAMREQTSRYGDKLAALMIELVQGEGGFRVAPREWYVAVFEEARRAGLAIWADEVQSFGRTGELFAFQTLGLSEYIDVVTIGKLLQACMVLYTTGYNPKPGLVAGTFTGSMAALRASRRVVELLDHGGYLGSEGRIARLSDHFAGRLREMAGRLGPEVIGEVRAIGGMIAFRPWAGTADQVKGLLLRLFDRGVVAFYCGHDPYLVRLLPPLGAMDEAHIDQVCAIIEGALTLAEGKQS